MTKPSFKQSDIPAEVLPKPLDELFEGIFQDKYEKLTGYLHDKHMELRALPTDIRENPARLAEELTTIRLNCNVLFLFTNKLYDLLNDEIGRVAAKRQLAYEEQLALGKSENAAKNHSGEITRIDEARIKVIENTITQVKGEFNRYDGICMMLQTRMRGFDSEMRMG